METRTPIRLHAFVLIAVFSLALILNLIDWAKIAAADEFRLGSLLHDDGYYYLLVADNVVSGRGATFDGVHPTTGFQPLYQGIAIGIAALARWSGLSIFKWIFFANLAFVWLAGLVIARTLSRIVPNVPPHLLYLFVGIILPLNFPLVFKRLSAGMESALALLLLSLFLRTVYSLREPNPGSGWHLFRQGLLCGALPLTRIDYGVLAAVFAGLAAVRWRNRLSPKHILAFGAGCAVLIGLYALLAYFTLDSFIPVSFLAKQYYASLQTSTLTFTVRLSEFAANVLKMWLYPFGFTVFGFYWRWGAAGLGVAGAGIALSSAGLAVAGWHKLCDAILKSSFGLFGLAVVVHALFFAWSGIGYVQPAYFWYYTPELALIITGLTLLYGNTLRGAVGAILLAVIALAFTGSTALYSLDEDIASYEPYREAIETARTLIPPTAVVGSWDAGFNAYWLKPRTVINLDGMVNSREYLNTVIRTGNYPGYFSETGIEYLLNMAPDTPDSRRAIQSDYFRHPSIKRACYDILAEMPFARQGLVIYLLKYHCRK